MKSLLIWGILLLAGTGYSQDSSTIFIPAGQSLSDVVSIDKIYRFPNFTVGKIYFKDGSVNAANINYNFLNGERELSELFGIQSIPTLLFIPVEGSLMVQKGALPKNVLQQVIEDRLLQTKETN